MAFFAKDLSPEQRLAIESLLGRSVSEKEAIAICAYEPPAISPARRAEVLAGLEAHLGALNAARQPTSPDEAEAVFEEAMRLTRPNHGI
jgi:hypothetical protein